MKNNNRGFTLAELLIVVAIIAVLVAIAIPVFTSQLEKARDATSVSNIRAAYAEAMSSYLTEVASDGNVSIHKDGNKIDYIDVAHVKFAGVQSGWSEMTTNLPANGTWSALTEALGGNAGEHVLRFTFDTNGNVTISVDNASGGSNPTP